MAHAMSVIRGLRSRAGTAGLWRALTVSSAAALLFGSATAANAQWDRPPEMGGRTASLGQPPRVRWQAGLGAGALFDSSSAQFAVRAYLGLTRHLLNPVVGLASIGVETYVGFRDALLDGGGRVLFRVPYLSMGVGADFNLRDLRLDFMVTAHSPIRRGGILVPGGQVRVDWYPARGHSVTLGVSLPLADPLAGRGRPIRDYVVVSADFQPPVPYQVSEPALDAVLDSLRTSAEWIRRLVVPFLDQDGRDAGIAVQRTQRYVRELRVHLALRSTEQEVRSFHAQLERAFTIAAGNTDAGRALARRARAILLDQVILPYNSLLGRKKRRDTLEDLGTAARGQFSRWVVLSGIVPGDRTDRVFYAFQYLTQVMDEVRRTAAKEWYDARLVWLPLQYALLPEDHDEQSELDGLLERATGVRFSDRNRVLYVANLQFHWELLRTIQETKSYHVLWIHDFPAVTADGALDGASLTQVVDGYLTTLAERVEAYDETGTLPSFFIFLDQHYYEQGRSRLLMTVLEDPLEASLQLPRGVRGDVEPLERAQERLRTAVRRSRVLQAEARQYGNAWLRNRIKVHVSITHRPDPSFWGGSLVSTVFGYADNIMRDHRKVAFRDVTDADPLGGVAILTGMGVGTHYLGPGWEDRSLLVQGPVLLDLRRAARDLLLSQGIAELELPLPLRDAPPGIGDTTVAERVAPAGFDTRALMLVNGTGYLDKPLNVAKAILYSLLPRGSVIKIPDALWNSTFFAGLLVGACVRGAAVSIVAPALTNAPSAGFPQMARAHELFTRLLLVRNELGDAMRVTGGTLSIGLYALDSDRRGFASRADVWARQVANMPLVQALMPFASDLVQTVGEVVTEASDRQLAEVPGVTATRPMLHQKVQFLATGELWDAIAASPEWPRFMATYLRYREATHALGEEPADAHGFSEELARIAERVFAETRNRPRVATYALLGSQNQDYRGMFMDGEVALLFSGFASLVPLLDLAFLEGTVTWVEDQQMLDRLLPPVGELGRRFARVMKDAL
ncbi:MAG: hypothetical protein IH965_13400 [Gemmatimonadetes bacterium]|nr:hypothetical protein [Gemmatimonadota bacterium]